MGFVTTEISDSHWGLPHIPVRWIRLLTVQCLGGLTNRHLLKKDLAARTPRWRCWECWAVVKTPPWWGDAVFSLCHAAWLHLCTSEQRESMCALGINVYIDPNIIETGPHLMPALGLNFFYWGLPPKRDIMGFGAPKIWFRGICPPTSIAPGVSGSHCFTEQPKASAATLHGVPLALYLLIPCFPLKKPCSAVG